MPTVILTDIQGIPQGTEDLLRAHTGKGQLHRAFSIFVFHHERSKLLLQKRAERKLLFANLWTNTCCSHPRPEEGILEAGKRRLREEFGFSCELKETQSFIYRAEDPLGHGVEHEYDTVLIGDFPKNATITPDPQEIAEWKWINVDELQGELKKNPAQYSPWFPQALKIALTYEIRD